MEIKLNTEKKLLFVSLSWIYTWYILQQGVISYNEELQLWIIYIVLFLLISKNSNKIIKELIIRQSFKLILCYEQIIYFKIIIILKNIKWIKKIKQIINIKNIINIENWEIKKKKNIYKEKKNKVNKIKKIYYLLILLLGKIK